MKTPVITSLLDTDLYKFTMMQAVFHQHSSAQVKYAFKCRNVGIDLRPLIPRLKEEIAALCALRFTADELDYLRTRRFLKSDFIDFLEMFYLQEKHIKIVPLENGEIEINIEGSWLNTILFEVPVLALVNQIYYETQNTEDVLAEGKARLAAKIEFLKNTDGAEGFRMSDFGTRRRFSKDWQKYVVTEMKNNLPVQFTGTSNVLLAKELNLIPIGTMAHEWLQAFQGLGGRLVDFQKAALESWSQEYRGDLGIALTDVVGMDAFLKDFDLYFCKLFDGVRHDSGSPYEWSDKMLAHYKEMKIDATQKQFVYSDGLTLQSAWGLYVKYKDQAKTFFGIGTNLTHDLGLKPLNVVLKMVECNGQPVAKVSDSAGKEMCKDASFIQYLKNVFNITK